MKESITKFDLEAAFKALDDLDVPVAERGIKANKPALTEIFSRKSKFDALFEDYYDISNSEELSDAKESREAEIAKAKLARIEKIVDLDAKSPEELLTSYVGKYIIQCPQCMTLFYKAPEDIEESEDDETTVNVNEVCQHCGNESGYTLVGKVGEVTPEEAENYETAEEAPTEVDVDAYEEDENTNEAEEIGTEEGPGEEIDFSELEELDLDIEDDETNESFQNTGSTLLTEELDDEDLTEGTDLEVSEDDFEELLKSSEFKKPISDAEVRALLRDEQEETVKEALNEGDLGKLGKTIAKKLKQTGQKIKDKASTAIDNFADKTQTREEKADFILKNAREDYENIDPDGEDRRFETFVILCYQERYSNGKLITMAPSYKNKDLVLGKNGIQEKAKYADADKIAKGWSMTQGNGPAYIYMAKGTDDKKAVFLCEYFQGELENDQLEEYFQAVKTNLEGGTLRKKGGFDEESEEQTPEAEPIITKDGEEAAPVEDESTKLEPLELEEDAEYKEIPVTDVKPDMIINDASLSYTYSEDDTEKTGIHGTVTKCEAISALKLIAITVKTEDGKEATFAFKQDGKVIIQVEQAEAEAAATNEGLNYIMSGLEELHESSFENVISASLVNSYKNVNSFSLESCNYLNEKFEVTGKASFKSGAERNLTYTFTEGYIDQATNKVVLTGLNEKLGKEKVFTLVGNTKDNTLVVESLSYDK